MLPKLFNKYYRIVTIKGTSLQLHGLVPLALLVLYAFLLALKGTLMANYILFIATPVVLISLLLHEVGHIIAASYFSVNATRIEINLLGAKTHFSNSYNNPQELIGIASAGVLMNLLFSLPFFYFVDYMPLNFYNIPALIIGMNICLALFNVMPAYPLDGAYITEGIIWHFSSRRKSVVYTGRLAKVASIILMIISGFILHSIFLVFLCGWLYLKSKQICEDAIYWESPCDRRY